MSPAHIGLSFIFFSYFFSLPSPFSLCAFSFLFSFVLYQSLFSVCTNPWPLCRLGIFPPESVAVILGYETFHQHQNTCIA